MRDLQPLAAATGIGGIVLFVVSILVVPTPPRFSKPAADVTTYLSDHGSALRTSQYVAGLAVILFLWFIGTLWSHLRRAEGPAGRLAQVFLASATAVTAVFLVQGGLVVVASHAPADAVSVAFFRVAGELAPHTAFLIGPMVASVGVLVLRHGGLPRPLGWYCLAYGAYELVEAACVLNADGALSPGGTLNVVGPILFSIWGLWTSGALVRAIGTPAPAAQTA
jgi:hypothetical protein